MIEAERIARSLIANAESTHPGNDWWGVQIARRHLEALVAEVERLNVEVAEANRYAREREKEAGSAWDEADALEEELEVLLVYGW